MKGGPDYIVLGSGPSGTSAAIRLADSGRQVLVVDASLDQVHKPIQNDFLDSRRNDSSQHQWFLGDRFEALRSWDAVSPKLRVPALQHVFEGFLENNAIVPENFVAVGSLAAGGLSNAWGCGVAALSAQELLEWPVSQESMRSSYANVARRIGISGGIEDCLSEYFGVDEWADAPIEIDDLQAGILANYSHRTLGRAINHDFRLGRSRVAALSQSLGDRQACNKSGNCLWGCARESLYSAKFELRELGRYPNVEIRHGVVIDGLRRLGDKWFVDGHHRASGERVSFSAPRVLLAAGTLATTRLALQYLGIREPVRIQHSPTAAFMLWMPRRLGRAPKRSFGLGQLSFVTPVQCAAGTIDAGSNNAFGSLFATAGIPVSEFARHSPMARRFSIDVLSTLLGSSVVGNVFLGGKHSHSHVQLREGGSLAVMGTTPRETIDAFHSIRRTLFRRFLSLGALVVPGSFRVASPGADIHYSSTLPMRAAPQLGQTHPNGELEGAPGLFIVDGASLPALTEKSHTLTIMANADRIAAALR